MIILITGSRFATAKLHLSTILSTLAWVSGDPWQARGRHELWDGSADGVDVIARRAVTSKFGWTNRPFAANWPTCEPDWIDPIGKCEPCEPSHRKVRKEGSAYCPTAGFRRNQRMVDALLLVDDRRVCVAFPIPAMGSHGTADCLTRAWHAGVTTIVKPLATTLTGATS